MQDLEYRAIKDNIYDKNYIILRNKTNRQNNE